jgi:hypothetical protein
MFSTSFMNVVSTLVFALAEVSTYGTSICSA